MTFFFLAPPWLELLVRFLVVWSVHDPDELDRFIDRELAATQSGSPSFCKSPRSSESGVLVPVIVVLMLVTLAVGVIGASNNDVSLPAS